ncbi:MAG: DUF563 domain-containing protein [Quinella sp. 1Q5]|nr:DUF563 domain-containing protein [Quinella sp. 1Q5]
MNLYVQDRRAWQELLSRKRFSERVPAVRVVKRGIVLPARKLDDSWAGGVCDKNFKFVAGYSRREDLSGGGFACVCSSYAVDKKNITRLDEDVIFGGSLIGHFGHFMLECWTRLWYVIEHPERREKILFITTTHGGYHAWFDDFFRLMGIAEDRIIYVKKPVQCRSVTVPEQAHYVPEHLRYGLGNFTKKFLLPYQAIKSHVKPGKVKRLYLTQTEFNKSKGLKGSHCFNEEYFEKFFAARGFEVVSPELLPIEEQISLIMGADEIAATMGTLTHWATFCKPTANFIMLTRTHAALPFQTFINEAFDFNCYLVDVSKNFLYAEQTLGVCMIGSTRYWKAFVADYFGERIEEDDDALYFDAALNKYLKFWCRRYPYEDKPELWLYSLKNLCNRIVTLEQTLTKGRPLLCYQTYTGQNTSSAWKSENQPSGDLDGQLGIQGIRIDFTESFHDVYYSVHCGGWSREVSSAQIVGTPGKSITGIKIRLDEDGAKNFDIIYRVHTLDDAWTPWAKNGEELLTSDLEINAVQIKLEAKQK